MKNPFESIGDKIDDIKRDVKHSVIVSILRLFVHILLAALVTKDPPNADHYQKAMAEVNLD